MEVLAASASLHQETTIAATTGDGSTAVRVDRPRPPRVNKISAGGIFGKAGFFLDLPQSVRCVALQSSSLPSSSSSSSFPSGSRDRSGGTGSGNTSSSSVLVLWTLDRASYLRMETRHPQLCLLIQHALLKVDTTHETRDEQQPNPNRINLPSLWRANLNFLPRIILHHVSARVWPSPTWQRSSLCTPRPHTACLSNDMRQIDVGIKKMCRLAVRGRHS